MRISKTLYLRTAMANKRSRKRKAIESEKKKMRDGIDREEGINSLPDSILHHVLSFLTMKEAIRTSLISKRWRYLWTCTPTLNFTVGKNKRRRYMEFMDAVLILRDSSSNIQRFSFNDISYPADFHSDSDSSSFDVDNVAYPDSDSNSEDWSESDSDSNSEDSSKSDSDSDDSFSEEVSTIRLNIWILNAIRHNVEEIHLEIKFDKFVKLPDCLFTSKSLRKLELICPIKKPHGHALSLPDSISLPRLEILHLDRLTLHHETDFKINHFLSSCSGLESLTLIECGLHQKNLNIIAPNLKHLLITDNSRTKLYLKKWGTIRLYAPNLISFHCKDYLLKSYCVENLPCLVEACIEMKVGVKAKREAGIWENGRNAMIHGEKIDIRILHNVNHLKLSAWALQIVIASYELLDTGSTKFHNLRSLMLQTWFSRDCIGGIAWLLNNSPNIVKLTLQIIEDTVVTQSFPLWDAKKVDPADMGDYFNLPLLCVLDHLKIVEIRGLEGRLNELKFLEILLENATVLEKLLLGFNFGSQKSSHDREKQLIKYSEILHLIPKASSSVTILLI